MSSQSKLAQLKEMTTVVADTGDFDAIASIPLRMPPPTRRFC